MRTTSLKRNRQQPQSRRLWSQQLLIRLLSQQPHTESGAISMAMGVVVALVLILSGVAVVQLSSGNLRGVFASSDTRQARGAAEEGTELMIDTWNQPQNRRLLVSGQSPTSWNAGNLRSPCFDARTNTRPGPNNDGLPDQTAINLGDGQWRDVVTGAVDVTAAAKALAVEAVDEAMEPARSRAGRVDWRLGMARSPACPHEGWMKWG